jgi:hypothetical protein
VNIDIFVAVLAFLGFIHVLFHHICSGGFWDRIFILDLLYFTKASF